MTTNRTKGCVALSLPPLRLTWASIVLQEACRRAVFSAEKRTDLHVENHVTEDHLKWADIIIDSKDGRESICDFIIDNDGRTLYVYHDHHFDIMFAARWLQSIILRFGIKRPFGFLYTAYSGVFPHGYGGGGAVVVKDDSITVFDADVWLTKKLEG